MKWESIQISLMVDSKVSFNSWCRWIPTTILLSNTESYKEKFGLGPHIWWFKVAQRQWVKSAEDNRVSSDCNRHTSFSNKV